MAEETIDYGEGRNLQAGIVTTDQIPLGIDVYHPGMLLEYQADGVATPDGSNTGNGTVTAIIADESVKAGDWVLTMISALVAKLVDPDGIVIDDNIVLADGAAVTVKIAGITMIITDGGTAFAAADFFTIAIEAAGEYVALDEGNLSAIYNSDGKTLASAGFGDCIMGGEINPAGLVSNAGAALVLTEDERAAYRTRGFHIKRVV